MYGMGKDVEARWKTQETASKPKELEEVHLEEQFGMTLKKLGRS